MKLVIQIPCHNEEATLPATIASLPKSLPGFSSVQLVVVDDGSTDRTAEVARNLGADRVVRLPRNQGLARAFTVGIEAALRMGADVIVNTDADNQYCADDIPAILAPVLADEADIVVGARPLAEIQHFSVTKRWLQIVGTRLVRSLTGTDVADATSGFRAYSRRAALVLNVFSTYTYTLETLVQAGYKRLRVASVPVRVNPPTRPSRLVRSTPHYLLQSLLTLARVALIYRPFRAFAVPATISASIGLALVLRFLYYYFAQGGTAGHIQSLVLAAILLLAGGLLFTLGVLADLLSVNRRLLEELQAAAREANWRDGG
jgi:glycosyltransferase involved in cell wall biosynthesis